MNTLDDSDYVGRDDVLLFNDVLSSSGHNVRKYKNKKQQIFRRSQRCMPFTTSTSHDQVLTMTIDNSDKHKQEQSQERIKINLDKLSMRRLSVTAGNTRRKHQQSLKNHSRNLYLNQTVEARQNLQASQRKQRKQNQFASIEKKYNKGPLKDKYVEAWLNNILTEVCTEEEFDHTSDNPALKKYGLDRNSLLSKGLSNLNLNRIYKSLFVYSIGFNDLLNQLCRTNMTLRKTVWKVYAILLQYCSQGSFETMIAQIQRDKQKKLQDLRAQIQKRQKIIQNNQQINQEKNAKIFKEIKTLREQNQNLTNQKIMLLEQYKQAEQAFNQQVTIRLKYENRINQIHGVYTQMETKHTMLYHELNQARQKIKKYEQRGNKQDKEGIYLRNLANTQAEDISKLQKCVEENKQAMEEKQVAKNTAINLNLAYSNKIRDLEKVLQEKDRTIEQQKFNNKNIKLLFQSEQDQHKKTKIQFSKSLQQNSKLHETIQDQMKDLNVMMLQRKNFGISTKDIKAESIVYINKYNNKLQECNQQKKINEQIKKEKEKIQANLQAQKKVNQQLQLDFQDCHQKIKSMKAAKDSIEQQFQIKKRQISMVDEIIAEKNQEITSLKDKNEDLQKNNADLNRQLKTALSKIGTLNQKVASIEEIADSKYKILKEEKEAIQKQWKQFQMVKKFMQMQLQKYKKMYDNTHLTLKNNLFEHNNLDLRYKQSLNVMQQQNQHIKALNIKISELKQQIFSTKRKLQNIQFINSQLQKQHKNQKAFWQNKIKQLTLQSGERKHHVHPMIAEDISGNYISIKNKYQELLETTSKQIKQLTKEVTSLKSETKRKQALNQMTINKITTENQKAISQKNQEIRYIEDRMSHLKEKNLDLETQLNYYIDQGKNKLTNEKEEKYLTRIKEQSMKIQQLMKELEQAHDANTKIRENFSHYDQTLSEKQAIIHERTSKIEKLIQSIDQAEKVRKEFQKKIDLLEATNKKLQQPASNHNQRSSSHRTDSGRNRPTSREANGKYQTINWKNNLSSSAQKYKTDGKRNDFARKYKGAALYYHTKTNQ